MNEYQPKVEIDNPYLKLTRTPLGRATTICGIAASNFLRGLCVVYILLDLIPGFSIAWVASTQKTPAEINEEFDRSVRRNQRYAALGLIIFFGIIALIATIVLIIGAQRKSPLMVFKSYAGLQVNTLLGRLILAVFLLVMRLDNLAAFMGILSIIDLIILGFFVLGLGKFAGECRNIKYSNPSTCFLSSDPARFSTSVNAYNTPQYATGV